MDMQLQFDQVEHDKVASLSFAIANGEIGVLMVKSQEAKAAVIDMALGESRPVKGVVLFQGLPLENAKPGNIGWIAAKGGLINNLKVWENITLPLWYHNNRLLKQTEESVAHWLSGLNLDKQEWEKFMASPVARLKVAEQKTAGLLRGLIQAPSLLVIDAALFDEVDETRAASWIKMLDKFVALDQARTVLVVSHTASKLPWKVLE